MYPESRNNLMSSIRIKKPPSRTLKFMKISFITITIIISCIAGIACGTVFAYIKSTKTLDDDLLEVKSLTTFVYDANKNKIAELVGSENKNRIIIPSDQIPNDLKNAFIAIEDERFKYHKGVDLLGVINAGLSLFTSSSRGGSTITQQVVKNLTNDQQRDLRRKVQEIWRAMDLEKRKSKDEIITLYCNIVYFNNACYGVESAAQLYFGKHAKELTLAQCACLAAIPNLPTVYAPFNVTEGKFTGLEKNKERREIILKKMLQQGYIDQQKYNAALTEDLKFVDPSTLKGKTNVSNQSYFVDMVINEVKRDLIQIKGIDEATALRQIYNGGLHIYTTCNTELQNAVDKVFCDESNFQSPVKQAKHSQASIVVIDPNNGQVVAVYGGFGEKKGSTLNRATQSFRQAGSSFKPISVYGPGINEGKYTAATVVDDAPVFLDPQNPTELWPRNFVSNDFYGLTTIRTAVMLSHNISAVKLYKNLPPSIAIEKYLLPCGIDLTKEKSHLSVCLGGLSKGVSAYQMASAYMPFANGGKFIEPASYTEVLDSNKKPILKKKQKVTEVYKPETAFIMTSILKDVVSNPNGTAYGTVVVKNGQGQIIPAAGKTGSTNDYKDKWFCGYTPYYVAAVWYGYDQPTNIEASVEAKNAMKIWTNCMSGIHEKLEPKDFLPPTDKIVQREICPKSGYLATDACRDACQTINEYFSIDNVPNEECDVHERVLICKDSNKIASDKCPDSSIEMRSLTNRRNTKQVIEPYIPVPGVNFLPRDYVLGEYEMPDEVCPLHGSSNRKPFDGNGNHTGRKKNPIDLLLDPFIKPSITPDNSYMPTLPLPTIKPTSQLNLPSTIPEPTKTNNIPPGHRNDN